MAKKKHKRQPKSGAKKKREKSRSAKAAGGDGGGSSGGIMQSMVRGLRQAAGVEQTKEEKGGSLWSNLLWLALIAAAAVWAYRNFVE